MSNPNWVRDEIVLALDVYVRAGCLEGGHLLDDEEPEVQELSRQLRALPIHPPEDREDNFRNPDGAALKLANFRAIERHVKIEDGVPGAEDLPAGMDAGSRLDRLVFEEFYAGSWEELHEEAAGVRATIGAAPEPAEPGSPTAEDAPIDGGGASEYESSSPATGGTRTRHEAELVRKYADHMGANGHEVVGRHYKVRDESRRLRADLYVRDLDLLIEAKGTFSRNAVRLGIGQLFDYRHLEDGQPELALLLPEKPGEEVRALLGELSISAIWPWGDGFRDTVHGKYVK